MEIKQFEGHGRKLTVEFMCWRCKKTDSRPLKDCLPKDAPMRDLSDLRPPANWKNGGFYHPTFCPDCAEKYEKFMRGEEDGK